MSRGGRAGGLCCAALWALASSSCSPLFEKSKPLDVRYYMPSDRAASHPDVPPRKDLSTLRLGRIAGASHLDVRLATRTNAHELVYRDDMRWTEPPSDYLERALAHALYEESGVLRALTGPALVLDAQLLAFEQAGETEPSAQVSVRWALHDERADRVYQTTEVTRKVNVSPGHESEALVGALSSALDDAVEQITARVLSELQKPARATE